MPLLSAIARKKKIDYFLKSIPLEATILEVGCGDGWVGSYLKGKGCKRYIGLDKNPPADVVGDIRDWHQLGLMPESFDVVIAFEVIEHVDCLTACRELLVPGGRLMLTSPLPHMDSFLKFLETIGLNQKRGSPHNNLLYFKNITGFQDRNVKTVGLMAQWGIFTK